VVAKFGPGTVGYFGTSSTGLLNYSGKIHVLNYRDMHLYRLLIDCSQVLGYERDSVGTMV